MDPFTVIWIYLAGILPFIFLYKVLWNLDIMGEDYMPLQFFGVIFWPLSPVGFLIYFIIRGLFKTADKTSKLIEDIQDNGLPKIQVPKIFKRYDKNEGLPIVEDS